MHCDALLQMHLMVVRNIIAVLYWKLSPLEVAWLDPSALHVYVCALFQQNAVVRDFRELHKMVNCS